jgi:hypothetical protein
MPLALLKDLIQKRPGLAIKLSLIVISLFIASVEGRFAAKGDKFHHPDRESLVQRDAKPRNVAPFF